jgi:exopolyphosphatase / guanosine-5'-triphosphate,3'-diphosphate pyrophosphatase
VTGEVLPEIVGPPDQAVIAGQLGRSPHDLTGIAARCPFGHPAIIETAPILTGGAPNPTLLYLTCPALTMVVSRAEAAGAVRALKTSCRDDEHVRGVLREITRLYQERRSVLVYDRTETAGIDPRLDAGIGGPEGPEKASCLHAYAAALLAVVSGWLTPDGSTPGESTPHGRALAARAGQVWTRFLPPVEEAWCRDNRCARWSTRQIRAAIDVGTISVRLLVADVADGRPRPLVRMAEVTRLGQDLLPGRPLAEAARRRTADMVARWVKEARRKGADQIVLAGTSAAREAADGDEFIVTLGRENGVMAVVLSGVAEAELAYAGASLDIEGDAVVLDVGGGSTEVTRGQEDGMVEAVSLELGASRSTERWMGSDPPTPSEIAEASEEAERAFLGVRRRFSGRPRLVGVAGTVTTLACLDAALEEYDAEAIHLRSLSLTSVRRLVAGLSAMTTDERAALPCVQAGRAPVIVAGAVIVQAAMETLGYDELTVSERDLLDGLVLRGAAFADGSVLNDGSAAASRHANV